MFSDKALLGIFRNNFQVRAAIVQLRSRGFSNSSIFVRHSEKGGDQDFSQNQKTRILTGLKIGAPLGAPIGLGLGLMLGPSAFMPELLTLFLEALCGGLLGGAFGALVGIGVPQNSIDRYKQYLKSGGILLSVKIRNKNQSDIGFKILESTGLRIFRLSQQPLHLRM